MTRGRVVAAWLLLVAARATALANAPSFVVQLDDTNFDAVLGDTHVPALVGFLAPWCGHCKTLAPEYEKVAAALSRHASKVLVAAIDADEHRDIASRFDIESYPTLFWFAEGSLEPEKYQGERTAKALLDFVNARTGLHAGAKRERKDVAVLTPETFDVVAMDPEVHALVVFEAPWCGHSKALRPVIDRVATAFADEPRCVVARVDADKHRDLAARFDVNGYPTLIHFGKGDHAKRHPRHHEGGRDEAAFLAVLNDACGTKRALDGLLQPSEGRVHSFDVLAEEFMSGDKRERGEVLAKARQMAASTPGADYYVRVMSKVVAKGDRHIALEIERLEGMVRFDELTPAKVTDIARRLNVLGVFLDAAFPEDAHGGAQGDGIVLE